MKKIKLVLSVILILFTKNYIQSQEFTTQQIYEKCLPSIVTLKVIKIDGSLGTGSAFLISEDGLAITAWHVAENSKAILAKFSDGEEFEVSGIKDKDVSRDICLLKIKCFGKSKLRLSPNEPKVGEKVAIIGAPKSLEFSISDGIVSQIQLMSGIKVFQFTCPASPGNSGSPLINTSCAVIGVVSFQFKEGQNLNFAIPSTYALGLDITLPTVPLADVKNTESFLNTINDENQKDKIFAKAFSNTSDIPALYYYVTKYNAEEQEGFLKPLPYFYFSVKDELKDNINKLMSFKYEDSKKEIVRATYIELCQNGYKSLELVEEGIKIARNNNGWTPVANESISRAFSYLSKNTSYSEEKLVSAFRNDSVFINNLDEYGKMLFEQTPPDWSKFSLGVSTVNIEPNRILRIREKSLAEEIGFEDEDILLDINGKKINNIFEMKKELVNNLDKRVTINVSRLKWNERFTEEIVFDVPKNLIEIYPTKN